MVEYWGAQAHYPVDSPSGWRGGNRYYVEPEPVSVTYTQPRDESNGTTIETIHQQILGMHPEYISTLADEWQNAYDLLTHVRGQLFDRSKTLHDEHWKSPKARDAFMKAGPGATLAYLDEWIDAAQNNVSALRALVGITIQARKDMDNLWTEYRNALDDAKYADGWTRFGQGFLQGVTLGIYDADAGIRGSESEAVKNTQKDYNGRAQDLAYRVAGEHVDAFAKAYGGYGPPFTPMDAVFNAVDHPPYFGAGAPPPPPPPPPPVVPPLVEPPPVPPPPGAGDPPTVTTPPAVDLAKPPGAADLTKPSVATGDLPGLGGLPLVTGVGPGGVGAPPAAGTVPGKAAMGASGNTPALPPSARGGGLSKGVLGRGAALRGLPPGSQAPPGRTLGRKPGRDQPGQEPTASAETEEGFGRPPASTTPPVLKRAQRTVRPGSEQELTPPTRGDGEVSLPGQSAAAPPVLNRPARLAPDPGQPGRTARDDRGRTARRGAEWVGVDAAREDTSAPVLDAPAAPVHGAAVSRLEEVPRQLRGRASTVGGHTTPAGPPQGTVAPELAARRSVTGVGVPVVAPGEVEDGQKIVTDEEAFSVDTPGGGVLAKGREDTSYRAEPPTALGGH